jgi:hypothetical protein
MSGGQAMAMRLALAKLAVRHGVALPAPAMLPLTPPADDGPLLIEGVADVAGNVDHTRMMFAPRAFTLPMIKSRMPRLLYRHSAESLAGTVDDLRYDLDGNVRRCAHVTDALAKRAPALSVSATVHAFELINTDTPDFFARILSASITEISLTPSPANGAALITRRYKEPAALKFYDLMSDRVKVLIKHVEIIRQVAENCARDNAVAPKSPARTEPRGIQRPPMIAPPRRPTQFSALAAALNERTA